MFKDARTLDRDRTAASFDVALRRYQAHAEKWFDGSAGSVDARLASCLRLLHSVRATVARLSFTDGSPYLRAAEVLDADRRALTALRDDLLTGASSREDVVGPPGWRTPARTAQDMGFPGSAPQEKWDAFLDKDMTEHPENYLEGKDKERYLHKKQLADWDDWLGRDIGQHPENYVNDGKVKRQAGQADAPTPPPDTGTSPGVTPPPDALGGAGTGASGAGGLTAPPPGAPSQSPQPGVMAALHGTDRRWVTLESAKFIAANPDALDDSHELATRAQHYAATKTSTFTPQRSAALCEAFVATVGDLGARSYRRSPVVRMAAVEPDWDPQAMFL